MATRGSVGPRLLPRTAFAAMVGGLATWLYVKYQFHVPGLAHTILGVALGLLLVFRTNASYDRYWEGRKLLGGIVNRTRDLARQLAGHVRSAEHRPVVCGIVRLLDVYFALAMQSLRSERSLSKIAELSESERKLYTAISSAVLTFALLGIDEIGVEIEDPFGYDENDLPIERIAETIKKGNLEILGAG